MEDKQVKEITERLDKLIRIAALSATKGLTTSESIILLSKLGLRPIEIAQMVGTTQNVVNVRLSKERKGNRSGKNG